MVVTNNSSLVRYRARSPSTDSDEDRPPRRFRKISPEEHNHEGLLRVANRPIQQPESHCHKRYPITQHQPMLTTPSQNPTPLQNHEQTNTKQPNRSFDDQPPNNEYDQTNMTVPNPITPTQDSRNNTTRTTGATPNSKIIRMDPAVFQAYQRVANHHPDPEATKALSKAIIQREANIYRQIEDLLQQNKILKSDHHARHHRAGAHATVKQEEQALRESMTTPTKYIPQDTNTLLQSCHTHIESSSTILNSRSGSTYHQHSKVYTRTFSSTHRYSCRSRTYSYQVHQDSYLKNSAQQENQRVVSNIDKMSLSELLPIIKSKSFYQHPRPVSTHNAHARDQSKWCDYHNAVGHHTDCCYAFREYVNRLHKEGYLDDLPNQVTSKRG